MIGAKAGQQVLMAGAGDGQLAAAVAAVTGLNGRTLVADAAAGARERVEAAAAEAGTLVDFEQADVSTGEIGGKDFDIVVLHRSLAPPTVPAQLLRRAADLVRTGGRVVVVEGGTTPGRFGLGRHTIPPALPGDAIRDLLASSGLRAARVLAESEGTIYVEASRAR